MEPTPLGAGRWKRSRERRLADRLLDLQMVRHELVSAFARVTYIDPASQRALTEVRAGWALLAPVERAFQQILERELAISEGRTA